MKIPLTFFLLIAITITTAQNPNEKEKLKKEMAGVACSCIDSISTFNKSNKEIAKDINQCIDKQVTAYQLGIKLMNLSEAEKDTVKSEKTGDVTINISTNKDSEEYKKYYYQLERYLMDTCASLKRKIAANEKLSENSISNNANAMEWYSKGNQEGEKGNYKKALKHYKKAVEIDPNFTFAWDNLGVTYRKLEEYDKAIEAYQNSLKINPKGKTPLQNIAIVYAYKKEFDKALEAYNRLAEIEKDNPEVYYGMGLIYFQYKNDNEKGLQNICRALRLYTEQKSPYRADAEKLLAYIYKEMKSNGQEDRFLEILQENGINFK